MINIKKSAVIKVGGDCQTLGAQVLEKKEAKATSNEQVERNLLFVSHFRGFPV